MGVYARSAEIIRRVRLEMPIKLTLRDPISSEEFELDRDNVLSLLVIDSGNLFLEGQTVAALFAEFARAQRACERAAAVADSDFAQWKAHMVRSYKAHCEASGKKGTDKDAEANYRAHEDYRSHAGLGIHYHHLSLLFRDLKEAFSIKAKMIETQSRMIGQHEHVTRADVESEGVTDEERGESTERLEELAAAVFAQSRGTSVSPPPSPPSVEEDDEEEEEYEDDEEGEEPEEEEYEGEEEEDEEEEEDDDLPPPPPPPPKRKRTAKKKTAKKAAKKKTAKKKTTTRKRSPRRKKK